MWTDNPFVYTKGGTIRTRYEMSHGNSKIGMSMLCSDTLSGDHAFEIQGNTIEGTCNRTCKSETGAIGCYSLKEELRYGNTRIFRAFNTWGLREEPVVVADDYAHQIEDYLRECERMEWTPCVRIHASGDLVSVSEAAMWLLFAQRFPKVHFYMYTKRYDYMRQAIDILVSKGCLSKHLDNFVLNVSVWGDVGRDVCLDNYKDFVEVNTFEVQTDVTELKGAVRCPAYLPNGKRLNDEKYHCNHCGLCWKKGGRHIVTYEH